MEVMASADMGSNRAALCSQGFGLLYQTNTDFCEQMIKVWWWRTWDNTRECPFCGRPLLLPLLGGPFSFSELLDDDFARPARNICSVHL